MKLLSKPFRKKKKPAPGPSLPTIESLAQRFPNAKPAHRETIAAVSEATMTSPERILALCEAVEYIQQQQIEGDVVECGVWKGGSMAAVARTLNRMQNTDRLLWLFDTFEGMSAPTEDDVDYLGQPADQLLDNAPQSQAELRESIWCRCSLDGVRDTMQQTGYPSDQFRFVKGKVEQTLTETIPEKIALLRLDTDWYESTRIEMEVLFPRLVPGGVLIIDDYGHWQGCRKAIDEYIANNHVNIFLHRVDYTGRLGIKQAG